MINDSKFTLYVCLAPKRLIVNRLLESPRFTNEWGTHFKQATLILLITVGSDFL